MTRRFPVRQSLAVAAAVGLAALSASAIAQAPPPLPPEPPSLKTVTPRVPDLSDYVKPGPDVQKKLVALGKAMFWDMSIGSQNVACATCHFSAGADARTKNQLSPGLNDKTITGGDTSFGNANGQTASEAQVAGATVHTHSGPNYTLNAKDFPFFQVTNVDPQLGRGNGTVVYDTNDVTSSQGAYNGSFTALGTTQAITLDQCKQSIDPIFHVGSGTSALNVRRVEPRNTPTMINAVFNRRNFWDGRARNLFNGVTPFGDRDNANAFLVLHASAWSKEQRLIPNLSLASQAVGPVVSDLEMICNGRSLADFGKKTLPRQPLANQKVAATDGVLASFRNTSGLGLGLTGTYADLVKAVFQDKWWNGGTIPTGQGLPFEGYQQIEANFSLFWGLAVASYQATLISDDSPYDRYKDSGATSGFAAQEGLDLFRQNGCIFCHNGPLFSEATTFDYKTAALEQAFGPAHVFRNRPIDSLFVIKADGSLVPALIDQGFFNLGVRPAGEDLGVSNIPDNSLARKYIQSVKAGGSATQTLDGYAVNPCDFTVPLSGDTANHCAPTADQLGRDGVDGTFKVPSLRNVELTGPYFHTGGAKTLEEVLDFYRRGGNSRKLTNDPRDNTTGFAPNDTNLAPFFPLGISDAQAGKIIDFLKSLTDDRVRCEKAPFDHPSLRVFQGIEGDENGWKDLNANGSVDETVIEVPAVGSGGLPALGRECLKPFDTKLTAGLPAN